MYTSQGGVTCLARVQIRLLQTKTTWFILEFFFHPHSSKVPLYRLSHHCMVLPEFPHILPQRWFFLLPMCWSHTTTALYCCIAWAVICLWQKLCIIKSENKKVQHWNVVARALTAKTVHRLPAILSVVQPFRNFTMGCRGCETARVNAGYFLTMARQVTSPTWGPHLHVNRP